MENILIRQCTLEDLDDILKLDEQWADEDISFEFTFVKKDDLTASFNRFHPYYIVAEHEGEIIGYLNGSVHVNERHPAFPAQTTYLEIENIYVHASFRDRHVGGQLLEKIFEIAEQNGINQFSLSTDTKDMTRILPFYERHGFNPWHVKLFKEL
jgi:ribosomal protein S18 acetylase RimI-like enzyme